MRLKRNMTEVCKILKAEERLSGECYQSPQKENSLKPARGCLKLINGGFFNQLLSAWFLEQAVSWKLLPGQAVKAEHRKGIRGITGLQTDAGSSRKGCTP